MHGCSTPNNLLGYRIPKYVHHVDVVSILHTTITDEPGRFPRVIMLHQSLPVDLNIGLNARIHAADFHTSMWWLLSFPKHVKFSMIHFYKISGEKKLVQTLFFIKGA